MDWHLGTPQGRRRFSALAIVVFVASACAPASVPPASTSQASAAPGSGGTLALRSRGAVSRLDPLLDEGPASGQTPFAYDRLVAKGARAGEVVPYLAKSWVIEPGKITFELRTDAVCEDGARVTPDVVANSFRRAFDPKINNGAPANAVTRVTGSSNNSVKVDDATHLTLMFGVPRTDILYGLSEWSFGIVCPSGLLAGADFSKKSYGSGPYTLESLDPGQTTVWRLRPEWAWGPNGTTATTPGFYAKIVQTVIPTETTAANLLIAGQLDLAAVSGADMQRLQSQPGILQTQGFAGSATGLHMNQASGAPLKDKVLREAVWMSVNPQEFLVALNGGLGKVAMGVVADTAECFDPEAAKLIPQFDMAKAKANLVAAGYVIGADGRFQKDGKTLTIRVLGDPTQHGRAPEYLADQFTKLGLNVDLKTPEPTVWNSQRIALAWDIGIWTAQNPIPTLGNYSQFFVGPLEKDGGPNRSGSQNAAAFAAAEAAVRATGPEICRQWALNQRALIGDRSWAPLVIPAVNYYSRGVSFVPWSTYFEPWALRKKV